MENSKPLVLVSRAGRTAVNKNFAEIKKPGVFAPAGSIGLARLADFLTRRHGPTRTTILDAGAMVLASAVYFTAMQQGEPR